MNLKRKIRILLILTAGLLAILALVFMPLLHSWLLRSKIRRSARDIYILHLAIELKSNDFGGTPLYPDFAFESMEARKRYLIPVDLDQSVVDQLGRPVVKGDEIFTAIHHWNANHFNVRDVNAAAFQMRQRQWRVFVGGIPYLDYATMVYEKKITALNVFQGGSAPLPSGRRQGVPRDPFGAAESDWLYRYGLTPNTIKLPRQSFFSQLWVVAGNGPDGDADIDVRQFRIGAAGQPVVSDPKTGRERSLLTLTYDPSNGTVSDGDIFLVDTGCFGDDDLHTHISFKKRYWF